MLIALSLAIAAAGIGAALAVQRVWRLTPAESMRPDSPSHYRAGWLEKSGLQRLLPLALRMVLRNLVRSPVKTMLTVLGLSLSGALIITGQFSFDALNEIIRVQFRVAQRDDVTITFNESLNLSVLHQIEALPGVLRAEPFLASAVVLRFGHHEKRTAITGLSKERQLRLILDENERPIRLPPHGLILTRMLADSLHMQVGELITVSFLSGRRQTLTVPVRLIIDEPIGSFAYMDLYEMARLLQQDITINGAFLAIDPQQKTRLFRALKATPAVGSVSLREATLQSFLDTVGENIRINNRVLISFACVIVAGVVYNSARIALSEHAIELASLRILGFSQREVALLLLTEQAILVMLAIPFGMVIGYGLAAIIAVLLSQELFRIPLVVSQQTFLSSALVMLLAAAGSGWLVWRRLQRQNLIEVLKTRE